MTGDRPLVVACGALASELRAVLRAQGLADAVEVRYLPAHLHNRPDRIVSAIDDAIGSGGGAPDREILVGYADCGTGGQLDAYLERRSVDGADSRIARLPGAHCYELFAGEDRFAELHDAEPGTFYLTDFLARHFDALVWQGLGLHAHPELRSTYFGRYRRVVFLSQSGDPAVLAAAAAAADRLELPLEHVHVGRGQLSEAVSVRIRRREAAIEGAAR